MTAAPALDLGMVSLFTDAADIVRRMVRGEHTPPPKRPAVRALPPAVTSSTEAIAQLRLLLVGVTGGALPHVPDELRAALTTWVSGPEEAAQRLAVETPPDAVIVADERLVAVLAPLTTRPIVVDRIDERTTLRARIHLAVAARLAHQIGGQRGTR